MSAHPYTPTTIHVDGDDAPRLPSAGWFTSLADIDGASNPPIYFYGAEDKLAVLRYYCPDDPRIPILEERAVLDRPMYRAQLEPTPPPPTPASRAPAPLPPAETPAEPTEPIVNPRDSYRITVTMKWMAIDDTVPRVAGKAPVPKKHQDSKSLVFVLRDSARADFIGAFLLAHGLHEKYRIGTNGPPFKLWWTGCGPKKDAITIDTDPEFSHAVSSILVKTGVKASVAVEFDTNGWVPFRVRKRVAGDDEDEQGPGVGDELLHGTKVPRVGDYDIKTRVNGHFIDLIEKKWRCNEHGGENNGPGCCFRDGIGNHWGLNMRKKKFYAAALAAGECTLNELPNTEEFDGMRNGELESTRPRGRNGPHRHNTAHSGPSTTDSPVNTLLAVLATKLLGDMTSQQAPAQSVPAPATPHKPSSTISTPFSPIPPRSSELHACLTDFLLKEGVDLTHCESVLAERRFIPSVLPKVPIARLIEVTGIIEGDAILFQSFCDTWCARLEEKKRGAAVIA